MSKHVFQCEDELLSQYTNAWKNIGLDCSREVNEAPRYRSGKREAFSACFTIVRPHEDKILQFLKIVREEKDLYKAKKVPSATLTWTTTQVGLLSATDVTSKIAVMKM